MPSPKPVFTAWGIAACTFAAASAAVLATRPMFVARATAEISRMEVAAYGIAAFSRVDISGGDRGLPVEIASRLRSYGTIRRALQALRLPADDAAVAEAAGRIATRLVAGTTVVEAIVRADSRDQAAALTGALFTAHETIRRERRVELAGTFLASLDAAMAALQKEALSVAGQIEKLELQRPAGEGRFNPELDHAFVDVAAEKARLRATIQRLEAMESADPDRQWRELSDVAAGAPGEHAFVNQAGYLVLRAGIAEKIGELAQSRAQHGENSAPVRRASAELAALREALRTYLAGQVTQLRAQLSATESTGDVIDARGHARIERSRTIEASRASPESEALLLRREAIRAQLGEMEKRRRELLVYQQVYEPSLIMLDAPQVSGAPEYAHRGARLVLAGFGALLLGFSLMIIFDRRAFAVL